MLRPKDREVAARLDIALQQFDRSSYRLPGIRSSQRRAVLVRQLLESIHRVEYVSALIRRGVSPECADPDSQLFDPVKAALVNKHAGRFDEACWMVFLFVHFGKHRRGAWRYSREVYGGHGAGRWTWDRVSAEPQAFRVWLHEHKQHLRRPGIPGGFGSHRKYESLDGLSSKGTGAAVHSYVDWVGPERSHQVRFDVALEAANLDPRQTFRNLYTSMNSVIRFGRTARFDYLAMLGKLRLCEIEPDAAYLQSSSGPLSGAKLLLGERSGGVGRMESVLVDLGKELGVGMQVVEDALCNWQKSPSIFKAFRG